MEVPGCLFWHVVYRVRHNNRRPAYAEHVPIYVHTYFIRCTAAEYAIPKPDGNLTRLSLPAWESGLRDYHSGGALSAAKKYCESFWRLSQLKLAAFENRKSMLLWKHYIVKIFATLQLLQMPAGAASAHNSPKCLQLSKMLTTLKNAHSYGKCSQLS